MSEATASHGAKTGTKSWEYGRPRLLRLPQVLDRVGVARSTLFRLIERGEFPPGVLVAPRCRAWPESAVDAFIRERIQAADAEREQA